MRVPSRRVVTRFACRSVCRCADAVVTPRSAAAAGGDVAFTLGEEIEQFQAFAGGQGLADAGELVEQRGLVLAVTQCHHPPKFCGIV